jgi:two-component system response regulator
MAIPEKPPYLVLLADDSEDDGVLLDLAFQNLERLRLAGRATDGQQTIAYLKGEGKYADRRRYPFPHVLLLDVRMPRVDGFEVLRWVRAQPLPRLLIVVLSGSDNNSDVQKALAMGAHLYRTKKLRLDEQMAMLKSLEQDVARHFPPRPRQELVLQAAISAHPRPGVLLAPAAQRLP